MSLWGSASGRGCVLAVVTLVLLDTVSSFVIPAWAEPPTARIVTYVRKRRAPHWDFWQLNSNVCPPSLCRASSEDSTAPAPRPRGTGGTVFYQGDVVLDHELDSYIFAPVNHTRYRRATVRLRNRLWKDGEVPYVFGGTLSSPAKRMIQRAIKHIQQRTCITFRAKRKNDTDFIKFISEPGCWSSIGRTGGRQLLSLGRGCENIGTTVHEITHSLGVWHEQARKDRDDYVKILEDNVSERFLKDFEKVNSQVSTSRGYPYDYTSVMHYSRYAFTKNGKPTIEVIGAGKELGLTIKQRNGLSTIDKAQIRDMYRCNLHKDTKQTSCPKGWLQHETECYQFFDHPKKQFAAAARHCKGLNSHLVFVESKREDEFLAQHLHKEFPYVYTWRTGGRKFNDTMAWFKGGSNHIAMDHTNWGKDQPSTFSTTALQRDRLTNETHWVGVWAGSMSQLPYFMYPFICERRAKRKCLKRLHYKDGRDYRGRLDHTMDGFTCQKWTELYPHKHDLLAEDASFNGKEEDSDGLGNHNLCRNPAKQRRSRPWCYTTKKTHEWQLCDVQACSSAVSGPGSSSTRKPAADATTAKPPRRSHAGQPGDTRQISSSVSRGRLPSSANTGGRRPSSAVSGRRPSSSSAVSGRIGRPSNAVANGEDSVVNDEEYRVDRALSEREKRRLRRRQRRHLRRQKRKERKERNERKAGKGKISGGRRKTRRNRRKHPKGKNDS